MKLTVQPGRKDKIHILIDGVYQTTVDALYFSTCGYRDGADLTAQEAADFLRDAHFRRAFNKASNLLSYQDRTRKQLMERLTPDFGADAAEAAVDRLEELRLVDDTRYAARYAEELRRTKGMAPRGIVYALLSRGIDRDTAEEAVQALEDDSEETLLDLLRTKYRGKYGDAQGMRRTMAALQRLGYGVGEIRKAMRLAADEYDEYEE